jgi:putative flippase GtrA
LAAVIDLAVFTVVAPRIYSTFVAALMSFIVAAAFNYTLSAVWVYRKDWRSLHRAASFLVFAGAGVSVNATVTAVLADSASLHPTLAKATGIGVAFILNFVLNTVVVFRR